MIQYYIGFPFAKLIHRKWLHLRFNTKYNALQRAAYFSVPLAGCLSVATGSAIHKPMQLIGWLWSLEGMKRHVFGISGFYGFTFFSLSRT